MTKGENVFIYITYIQRFSKRQTAVLTAYMHSLLKNQNVISYLINITDLGLQSNFRLLLDWILHHFHDVCGAESLHFSDSGCFQRGAEALPGVFIKLFCCYLTFIV